MRGVHFIILPASPCPVEFYEIWNMRSTHRRNHMCQFFSQSVEGLQSSDTPKLPFPIDLLRRPYNSVLASLKTDRTTARPHSRPHSWMATARPHRRQHKQRPAWTPEITAAVDLWWSAVFRQTPQQCCKCMHAAWPKQDNVPAFKLRTNNSVTN